MRTMRNAQRAWLLAAVGLVLAAPSTTWAQIAGTTRGWTYRVDARPAEGRTDRLGLDFDIQYSNQQAPIPPRFDAFGMLGRARGFSSFDRASRDVNALALGLSVQGWHYSSRLTREGRLRPDQYLALIPVLEKQGDSLAVLTAREEALLDAFLAMARAGRRFFTYGLAYQLETTQDVDVSQHVLGATTSIEVPRLGELLDVLPRTTRGDSSRTPAFPVRALLAVDYVRPPASTSPGSILVDTATWRLRSELAWSAVVLDRYVLRVNWEAHYFPNPSRTVRDADRSLNSFLEAALAVEIADGTSILIKYLSGRLPPTYALAGVSTLGLSFAFFPTATTP